MRIDITSKYFYSGNMYELEEYREERLQTLIDTFGETSEFKGVEAVMEEDECLHIYLTVADDITPKTAFSMGQLVGWLQRHGSL